MNEQIMVFSKEWFKKHNKTLCWFANAPIIKYWFRWLLRIHKDIPWNEKISEIMPNAFTYEKKLILTKDGLRWKQTTDFRTHEKFGKRLYYGLKPFWYLLHFWDWSTSIQPALNCGFDTLTVYPDAGTGNTTVDGTVSGWDSSTEKTWSWLVSASGKCAYATFDSLSVSATAGETGWYGLSRGIFTFDTSSITSSGTISAAKISLYKRDKLDQNNWQPDIDIYTSSPASNNNLQASDYSQIGTISQTGNPITYSAWGEGYNDFTFNATGRGNISKTGISKFGIRNANYDVANIEPTHPGSVSSFILGAWSSDYTGTTRDPKLVVTYTLPSTFIPRTMWF